MSRKLIVVFVVLIAASHVKSEDNAQTRHQSATNMNMIAKAAFEYADVPANSEFPKDPAALVPAFIKDASILKCPRFPDQAAGYIWVHGIVLADETNHTPTIFIFENVPEAQAGKGRNVVLTQGVVEFKTDEEFKKLLKASEE